MTKVLEFGVDVGGTFTDILVRDEKTGEIVSAYKVPSTPSSPDVAITTGVGKYLEGTILEKFSVIHATTVGTNTLIEKKGAKTALVTTRGFRDVLEIRRQVRPRLYDLSPRISEPLVARELRIEVDERIGFDGKIIRQLTETEVDRIVDFLSSSGVKSIAICLIHSYANDAHERQLASAIVDRLPDIFVTTSADVCPEFREFERTSTVAINAYLGPRVQSYMRSLRTELGKSGATSLSIVKSNGGLTSAQNAGRYPVHLIESGPAAGIMAAAAIARAMSIPNMICFDMGGTTAKAGVVIDGKPRLTTEFYADKFVDGFDVGGYPIKSPVIDVIEIGAGGGSIASITSHGSIQVGPQSAGASPGPACYGLGGVHPTVTDAHLVLGNLSPEAYGPDNIKMDKDLAVDAISRDIATPLNWSVERAASGIIALATARMVEMVRVATVQRGLDPREFALLAYGGAGPLHACEIGAEIGVAKVLIPPYPGLFSAMGTLLGEVRHDFVRTLLSDLLHVSESAIADGFLELTRRAKEILVKDEISQSDQAVMYIRSLDVRYKGQLFELNIPILDEQLPSLDKIDQMFRDKYSQLYGYELAENPTELVNIRLVASLPPRLKELPGYSSQRKAARSTRQLIESDGTIVHAPVLNREAIVQGSEILGPCIVEDMGATVRVMKGQILRGSDTGSLIVERASK